MAQWTVHETITAVLFALIIDGKSFVNYIDLYINILSTIVPYVCYKIHNISGGIYNGMNFIFCYFSVHHKHKVSGEIGHSTSLFDTTHNGSVSVWQQSWQRGMKFY